MEVSTGTGRNPIKPVAPRRMAPMTMPAVRDTAWVFPPYWSFMEVLEILPFTGQQPTAPEARLAAA